MQHDTSAVVDTIQAMHNQESSGYICGDYLNMHPAEAVAVNVDCRTKMAQWCYSVSNQGEVGGDKMLILECSWLLTD